MSVVYPVPQKFSFLKNDGTAFVPDPTKTYKIDLNGAITIWDGVVSTLAKTDLLLPGNNVYTPDSEFRWQMMARNATILNNRSTRDVDMSDFIQGVWGAPAAIALPNKIVTAVQLNDINAAARGAGDVIRVIVSTSATDPFAGVPKGLTLTTSVGTVTAGNNTSDLTVTAVTTGDVSVDALSQTGNITLMAPNASDVTATSTAHGLIVGDFIRVDATSNDTVSAAITAVTTNTFDYTSGNATTDGVGTWTRAVSGFLHMLKSSSDATGTTVKRAVSAAVNFGV